MEVLERLTPYVELVHLLLNTNFTYLTRKLAPSDSLDRARIPSAVAKSYDEVLFGGVLFDCVPGIPCEIKTPFGICFTALALWKGDGFVLIGPYLPERADGAQLEEILASQGVMEMTQAYMEGAHEVPGFCCAAKHFPGDGLDDRDQHVANSVNTFSCEEWDATFGKIYANLIDNGLEAIMAGHIMLPSYTRAMNPDIKDDDIMPATLSKELLTDLLKGKMGFNGMVLTDASHMVGLTCRMKRSDMIPAAIAAGCDMFLFFNDMDEDFASMMNGYKNGVITDERLDDALHRILALKAHMGLHKKARTELVPPAAEMERVIGCAAHRAMQKEISEHALTLVKYKDADVLPMTPEKYRRIMIVYVTGLEAKGLGGAMKKLMGGGKNAAESLKEKLEAKGFEVTLYESPMDKIQKRIAAGEKVDFNIYFAGKDTIADFVGAQDLIITLVDVAGGFQAVARPGFGMTKGGGEIPWYVFELPVIVIGCQQPTILADIPQARTYINTYDSAPATLDVLVDELMAGPEAFKGKDPIDSFCGMWDTHL